MRFRNCLQLFMENFKNVYRLLIYKFIVLLLACALCCAFILPELQEILKSSEVQTLFGNVKSFGKAFFTMDAELLSTTKEALLGNSGSIKQALRYLTNMTSEIVWTSVACLLVFLVKYFIDVLCDFAIGSILNDKMTSYAETPFFTAYVANLGKASKYALAYVPISFLFNVIALSICYLCVSVLPIFVALFLSVTVTVVIQALKMTLVGHWMPAETIGKKMVDLGQMGELEKRQKLKEFSTYIVSIYGIIIINAVGMLCTFGSSFLITIPASYMFLICMQYVNYYTAKGKKYFLTYEKIENNIHYGDSEHFFEYVEKEEKQEQAENENIKESE